MNQLDKTPIVVAAAASGTAAVLVFALLPVLAGAFADRYQLNDVETGLVATSYFAVYALITLTSGFWIRRVNWVHAAKAGYIIMLIGLLICLLVDSFKISSLSLALVGVGGGLLFPISLTLVSDMQHTDRTFAFKTSAEQLIPAGLLLLLSSALFADYDLSTLLSAIIAVLVACFLFTLPLPEAGNPEKHTTTQKKGSLMLAISSLLALAISFAGFAGVWAFLERIAVENNFDAAFTASWLAAGLVTSGIGPLIAAACENRFGRRLPILLASGIALACLFLFSGSITKTAYASALCLLPLAYYFAVTYMFAVVAEADHNGRMSGLMAFALAVGAASGPVVFGLLKSSDGPVLLSMGTLIALGALAMALVQTRLIRGISNDQ